VIRLCLFVAVCTAVLGCALEPEPLTLTPIAAHLPVITVPPDNPQTADKVFLGRKLFYEPRLSSDNTISCASCHRQEVAFSDAPRIVSLGVEGRSGNRNSPSIVNAAYRKALFWDGRAALLETQAHEAFRGSLEMNADTVAVGRLMRSQEYAGLWQRAFGDTAVSIARVMQAIASFERTIVSANSRYDQFVAGNNNALSAIERDGMRLFFSSKSMCSHCHGGFDFTNDEFHNIGLFEHYFDLGRYNQTNAILDQALFKTPGLRNVALTPPYMASGESSEGVLETLEQVVQHYNEGGTSFFTKDKRVRKLELSDYEMASLVAFMKSLTDSTVLTNPAFSRP
jgi:cytochrome c peroxidase